MYFVTDAPRLFNTETGIVIRKTHTGEFSYTTGTYEDPESWKVEMNGYAIFFGNRQECEDFIYALAGWVGAANPMARQEKDVVMR